MFWKIDAKKIIFLFLENRSRFCYDFKLLISLDILMELREKGKTETSF